MRTRIEFEPSDFEGCGQTLIRQSVTKETTDLSYAVSVAYKVGYISNCETKCALLISLADGMALQFDGLQELCDYLNRDHVGFRPMTGDEIARVLGAQGSRFAGAEKGGAS